MSRRRGEHNVWGRFARLPLWLHAGVLAAMLTVGAMWVGAAGTYSVDEGIAVIQAKALANDGWTLDYPLELIDQDGSSFPLRSAEPGERGWVPYGKHPLYPSLLAQVDRVGGVAGMIGLSIAGTALAACAGALIARRLTPTLAAPAVYVLGLGSPLLFDSFLVIGHTLAAAVAGFGALALLRHHDGPRRWISPWLGLGGVAMVVVVFLRGEGLLLVAALGAASLIETVRTRAPAWCATGGLSLVCAAVALLLRRAWREQIYGSVPTALAGYPALAGEHGASWASDRLEGLITTTVRPSYDAGSTDLLLVASLGCMGVAVLAMRRGGSEERTGAAFAVIAALLAVGWVVVAPASPVPGILIAFPILWAGLAMGGWQRSRPAMALAGVPALFALGVAATQYRQGGGLEWGARYVAIVLPLVVPVALFGLQRARAAAADHNLATAAAGSLLAVTVALSAMALQTQRETNRSTAAFQEHLPGAVVPTMVGAADRDGRPVVVSTAFILPQLTWSLADDYRWLLLDMDTPESLPSGVDPDIRALLDAGVDQFTFITPSLERDRPLLGDTVQIGKNKGSQGWTVVTVTAPTHR